MTSLPLKLQEATEGSAEFDGELWCFLNPGWVVTRLNSEGRSMVLSPGPNGMEGYVSDYTTSLDAAVALVESKLPGAAIDVTRFARTGLGKARLWQNYDGHRVLGECERAATPALALCLALLLALDPTKEKTNAV